MQPHGSVPNVIGSVPVQPQQNVIQAPKVLQQTFLVTLGTGIGCNCFSCLSLCAGMIMASVSSMATHSSLAFFGMICTVIFMIAGSVVFCSSKNEMYVKRVFVALAGCVAFVQIILLITALATSSATAKAICDGRRYRCYSSVTLNCKCDATQVEFCDVGTVSCWNKNTTMSKNCGKLRTSLWDLPEDNKLESSYGDRSWRGFKNQQACLNHKFDGHEDGVESAVMGISCCICWCLMCGLFPAGASAGHALTPYKDLTPLTQGHIVQPAQMAARALPAGWAQHADPQTGRTYYVNTATQATQWTFPDGAPQPAQGTVVQGAPQYHPQDPNPQAQAQPGQLPGMVDQLAPNWVEHIDPTSGNPYYSNTVTGDTVWDRPTANGTSKV